MTALVADWIFAKGLVIGLLIAAPVGPVNLLCAARSLTRGWRAGMFSGLGAAAADTAFGAIAALGLGFVAEALVAHRAALSLLGALFLAVYGWRALAAPPARGHASADRDDARGAAADALSAFALTLANPITVFSFLGVYVAFGIEADATIDRRDAALLVGIFLGASAWWFTIATAASLLRARFSDTGLAWANRIAGLTILGFAAALLVQALA
jgi:threonine/homoserine/homoserine lactone efflux protein